MTEVMKTSLLAKRWRYIWNSVLCLNFDLREFWKQKRLSYGECLLEFWLFVKWTILIIEASTIYKVRFFCDYFDGYQLELLLFLCAVRNVRELYISAGYGVQLCPLYRALPENVETITENIRHLLDLEPLTRLWNFKTLHLVGVRFPNADITERLFGECAFLENLSIESCCFLMIKFLKISTKKLRKLNFMNLSLGLWGHKCTFDGELELHTPNLESFCYIGPAIWFSESADMPYLKNASILHRRIFHPRVPSKHLCLMVSAIHHVENLSLSAYFLQTLLLSLLTSPAPLLLSKSHSQPSSWRRHRYRPLATRRRELAGGRRRELELSLWLSISNLVFPVDNGSCSHQAREVEELDTYAPLSRTRSLPTEVEEEWRRRKEFQSMLLEYR